MLEALFSPQGVAVVGASTNPAKLGHSVLDNIIKYGYRGQVHPFNPRADEILGRTCHLWVTEIPGRLIHQLFRDRLIGVVISGAPPRVVETATSQLEPFMERHGIGCSGLSPRGSWSRNWAARCSVPRISWASWRRPFRSAP